MPSPTSARTDGLGDCSTKEAMEVSQGALARMLLCCLLAGIAMGAFEGLVRSLSFLMSKETPTAAKRLVARLWPPQRLYRRRAQKEDECKPRKHFVTAIVTAVEDAVCLLVAATTLIVLLYATNDGQFRLSAVAGMLIGYLLYRVTLKHRLEAALAVVWAIAWVMGVWCVALAFYPVRALLGCLWRKTRPLRARLIRRIRAMYQAVKHHTRHKTASAEVPAPSRSERVPNGQHHFSKGNYENNR